MKPSHVCWMMLFLWACADQTPDAPDASLPDVWRDEPDAEMDADDIPDVAKLDTPPPIETTIYEADCTTQVYVDLSGQGAWPFYSNWFAKFPLSDLDGPIKTVVKTLMCDPHSESNGRCPPYWNCDRDEDPEHPGCVWSTHEIKNNELIVACGQDYFSMLGGQFDHYRYRFNKALIEVTHTE